MIPGGLISTMHALTTIAAAVRDSFFKNVSLLINGDRVSNISSAATQRFIDSSTNDFQLTSGATPAQGSFSPFTATSFSTYFATASDSLTTSDATKFGSALGTAYTVEMWYMPASGTSCGLYDSRSSGKSGVYVGVDSGGHFTAGVDTGGSLTNIVGTTVIVPGTWYHIAVCRASSTSAKLFVNGVQEGSTYTTSTGSLNSIQAMVGKDFGGLSAKGWLSNVNVTTTVKYTSAFTPTTSPLSVDGNTQALFCQANRHVDVSANAFAPTVAGTPTIVAFNPFTRSSAYSYGNQTGSWCLGSSDTATVTLPALGTAFTIEFWIYPFAAQSGANIINQTSGARIGFNGSTLSFGNSGAWTVASSVALTSLQWNHVAVVRSGTGTNQTSIYVNGVQRGQGTDATTFNSAATTISGAGQVAHISDVRVVKSAVYSSTFTPPSAPLTAISNTAFMSFQSNGLVDNGGSNLAITTSASLYQPTNSPYAPSFNLFMAATGNYASWPGVSNSFDPASGDFTLEGWVYPKTAGYFMCLGSGVAFGNSLYVGWSKDGGANTFTVGMATSGSSNVVTSSAANYPANAWYHVAVTRSSGTTTLWVNGVSAASTATNASPGKSNCSLVINGLYDNGGIGNTGGSFYVSNVRWTKGTARYTSTFAVPTASVGTSGATSLVASSPLNIDSVTGTSATIGGTVTLSTYGPFTTASRGSLYFTGSTDVQTASSTITSILGTNGNQGTSSTFTIEAWVYPTARTSGTAGMIGDMVPTTVNNSFSFGLTSSGVPQVYWWTGAGNTCTATTAVPLYAWTHLALVVTAGVIKIYVNGKSETLSGTTTLTASSGSNGIMAVGRWASGGTSNSYIGYMSDIRISKLYARYSANFTVNTRPSVASPDVSLLLAGTDSAIYDAAERSTMTISGVTVDRTTYKYGSGSLSFNGSSSVTTSVQDLSLVTSWTVESWVRVTSAAAAQELFHFNNGAAAGISVYLTASGGLTCDNGSNSTGAISSASSAVTANTWFHLAIVKSGSTITIYKDGVSVATNASAFTPSTVTSVSIGKPAASVNGAGTAAMTGFMDDVRVTHGIARYTTTFTPPNVAFLAQ